MRKAHFNALGKVFASEIEQALSKGPRMPFQSKAKVYRELSEGDYPLVRPVEVKVGKGPLAVTVKGWELTLLGNLAYCTDCRDVPEEA